MLSDFTDQLWTTAISNFDKVPGATFDDKIEIVAMFFGRGLRLGF